jgi:hypothetical protein
MSRHHRSAEKRPRPGDEAATSGDNFESHNVSRVVRHGRGPPPERSDMSLHVLHFLRCSTFNGRYLHSMHTQNTRPFPFCALEIEGCGCGTHWIERRAAVVACGVLGCEKEASSDVFNWGNANPTRGDPRTRRAADWPTQGKVGKAGPVQQAHVWPELPDQGFSATRLTPTLMGTWALCRWLGRKMKSKQINKSDAAGEPDKRDRGLLLPCARRPLRLATHHTPHAHVGKGTTNTAACDRRETAK